jgi:hypothetical protein
MMWTHQVIDERSGMTNHAIRDPFVDPLTTRQSAAFVFDDRWLQG